MSAALLFGNSIARRNSGQDKLLSLLIRSFRSTEAVMGISKEQLQSSLSAKLNPSHLEVIDTSGGCGASFMVSIVSDQFEGKRLLERHRMVNSALTEEMKEIHALSITKALTPEQWKQQQDETSKSQAAA